MTRVLLALAAMLVVAPAASAVPAAPPTNDNRADAEVLPVFPATASGTTAEATVERLDPQVSDCGRIDETVWYRIESAPDGRIVVSVQAAAELAPVVRVYRRGGSAISELDCGTAAAGGRVVTSFETVRGAGYFILVGRRPGEGDGAFQLQADLFLPPENDRSSGAAPLGSLPTSVESSTLGATGDASDRGSCGLAGGTVWYRLTGADRRVVLRLRAAGELDAAVAVFERVRSQLERVTCAPTNRTGDAVVAFDAVRGRTYLIAVGQRRGSDPGSFTLSAVAAEAPEALVGRRMPAAGASSSVHGLTDVNDVWARTLREGTTYLIAFSSRDCATVALRAPGVRRRSASPLLRLRCDGFVAYTPRPDRSGRYTLEVVAAAAQRLQPYRLRVVPAGVDDLGVGVPLANGATTRGRLAPRGGDLVDLYHFDVDRTSDVTLALRSNAAFQLVLLRDTGGRLSEGPLRIRRRLESGRYVVAVRGPVGSPVGSYALSLLVRDVTSTSIDLAGGPVALGTALTLTPLVSPTPASGS